MTCLSLPRRSIVWLALLSLIAGLAGCAAPSHMDSPGWYGDFDFDRPSVERKVFELGGGKFLVIEWTATVLEGHPARGEALIGFTTFNPPWQSTQSIDFDQSADGISFAVPDGTRIDRVESGAKVAGCNLPSGTAYGLRITQGTNSLTWAVVKASDGSEVIRETFAVTGGFPSASSLSVTQRPALVPPGKVITVDYKGAIVEFWVQ